MDKKDVVHIHSETLLSHKNNELMPSAATRLTPQFKNINSLALSLLYSPTLISIHDYWKNPSFDYTDFDNGDMDSKF